MFLFNPSTERVEKPDFLTFAGAIKWKKWEKWATRQGRLKKTTVHTPLFWKKIGKYNISKYLMISKKLGNQDKDHENAALYFCTYFVSMINVTPYHRIIPCLAGVFSLFSFRLLFSKYLSLITRIDRFRGIDLV